MSTFRLSTTSHPVPQSPGRLPHCQLLQKFLILMMITITIWLNRSN